MVAWWRSGKAEAAGGSERDWLSRLANAGTVAFGGVGIASTTLPETEAYLALRDSAAVDRSELDRLLRTATPAGRVYAAELLTRLDPAAGVDAWRQLRGDSAQVSTFSGCVMGTTTLAEYAEGRLATLS